MFGCKRSRPDFCFAKIFAYIYLYCSHFFGSPIQSSKRWSTPSSDSRELNKLLLAKDPVFKGVNIEDYNYKDIAVHETLEMMTISDHAVYDVICSVLYIDIIDEWFMSLNFYPLA